MDEKKCSNMQLSKGGNRHHECAICQEKFTSPRLLPCFHTFCLSCLQQLVYKEKKDSTFNCPICRSTTKIPAGGVGCFQVNFYIEAEVEGQQVLGKKKCEICCKDTITHKCCNCDQFMCDTCTKLHAAFASTKSHTVLNLQTDSTKAGEAAVVQDRYCTVHKEEKLRFFCTKCRSVICRDCKLTSHEGHASVDLVDRSKGAKSLIKQVSSISFALEKNMEKSYKECMLHKTQVSIQKEVIVQSLKSRAAELHKEIEDALQEAIKKLDDYTAVIGTTAEKTAENLKHELACFSSLKGYSEGLLQKGSDADVVEMPSHFQEFFGKPNSYNEVNRDCKIRSFTDENWKVYIQHTVDESKAGQYYGSGIPKSNPRIQVKSLASQYLGTLLKMPAATSQNLQNICHYIKDIQQISANWK